MSGQHISSFELWNVYNAPTGSVGAGNAIANVTNIRPSTRAVILGDFNLRHREWDPSIDHTLPLGTQLADRIDANNLSLTNPLGIPTHSRGGVLDLVLSNLEGTQTIIPRDLHSTSDHKTLWTIIPASAIPTPSSGRLRLKAIDSEKFISLLQNFKRPASEDVEVEAQLLVQALSSALQGSTPRTKELAVITPWWTNECQSAARTYRRARRMGPSKYEQAALRRTVRAAKREYWRKQVETAATLPEVYKIAKWGQQPSYHSPSLKGPERPVTTPLAKAQLFRTILLSRHIELDDIPEHTPTVPQRKSPWPAISADEAYNAACRAKSTTPGIDEIPVAVIKLAWPTIGEQITALYQQCTALGIHPKVFKQVEMIILLNSGPRDRTLPKFYRPIALLSCLGKGLERLIVQRMNYCALQLQILAHD